MNATESAENFTDQHRKLGLRSNVQSKCNVSVSSIPKTNPSQEDTGVFDASTYVHSMIIFSTLDILGCERHRLI